MSTVSPEKRQFILVADQSELPDILKNAENEDTLDILNPARFFNFKKDQKKLEADLKILSRKLKKPLSLFEDPEHQEMLDLLSVLVENDFTWYSPEEAKRVFKFEPDLIPTSGTLYCKHPLCHERYLSPSSANVRLAREKIFKFTELAAFLGAKRIQVDVGDISNEKNNFSTSWEEVSQIGLNFTSELDRGSAVRVVKEYEKPKRRLLPKTIEDIPMELNLWLDYDPMFRSMAIERIKYGLLKQTVKIDVKEMIKINAKTVSKFVSYGIEMGGNYERLMQSSWKFIVEFWSKDG